MRQCLTCEEADWRFKNPGDILQSPYCTISKKFNTDMLICPLDKDPNNKKQKEGKKKGKGGNK